MSARVQNEAEIAALLIAPDRALAQQFLATLPQTRTFQILADLKSYPPQQTLEIRIKQLKPNIVLLDLSSDLNAAVEVIKFIWAALTKAHPSLGDLANPGVGAVRSIDIVLGLALVLPLGNFLDLVWSQHQAVASGVIHEGVSTLFTRTFLKLIRVVG